MIDDLYLVAFDPTRKKVSKEAKKPKLEYVRKNPTNKAAQHPDGSDSDKAGVRLRVRVVELLLRHGIANENADVVIKVHVKTKSLKVSHAIRHLYSFFHWKFGIGIPCVCIA